MTKAGPEVRTPAVDAVFEPVHPPTTFEETVERLGTAIRLGLLALVSLRRPRTSDDVPAESVTA